MDTSNLKKGDPVFYAEIIGEEDPEAENDRVVELRFIRDSRANLEAASCARAWGGTRLYYKDRLFDTHRDALNFIDTILSGRVSYAKERLDIFRQSVGAEIPE